MISSAITMTLLLAGQALGAAPPDLVPPPSMEPSAATTIPPLHATLSAIDQVLRYTALCLVAVLILASCLRSRRGVSWAAAPRRHDFRQDTVTLLVFVYVAAMFVLVGVVRLCGYGEADLVASLIVANGAQIAGGVACMIVASKRFDGALRRFLWGERQAGLPGHVLRTVVGTVLALGCCPIVLEGTMAAVHALNPEYAFKDHATIVALHDPARPIGILIALWVGAALIAPAAEELFFRGILQSSLAGMWRTRWSAIAVAAVVFAAIHFPYPHTVPALILFGLLVGYVYESTGALVWPFLIHVAFNLKALIWDALSTAAS